MSNNILYQKVKDIYLTQLEKVKKLPDGEQKIAEISKIYKKYRVFCYKHKLKSFFGGFFDYMNESFIIESEPITHDIQDEQVIKAIADLNGGSITQAEGDIILKWVVKNARTMLSNQDKSLLGCCGLGRVLTILPFREINIPKTINNIYFYGGLPHAFATITLPITNGEFIQQKQFLIDVTYRQFFSTLSNNEGCYYDYDEAPVKNGPEAGYYICKHENGKRLAQEILKNGYIEINEEKIRIYIDAFRSVLHYARTNPYVEQTEKLQSLSDNYLQQLNEKQEELGYTLKEVLSWNYNIDFPSYKRIR